MEAFLIYMAKAAGLMAIFYIAYHLLLRKETFFSGNRKFLLIGLITSVTLPLMVFTKTVFVEPAITAQPIDIQQYLAPKNFGAIQQTQEAPVNWGVIIIAIYCIGALFFISRFIMDLIAIKKLLKGRRPVHSNGFNYIDSENIQSPFSFFNYIVYNSKKLSDTELQSIISHEQVHSRQKHSLDMIISQLFCIAFWFNPFTWFYKKAVAQNLEFIADAEAAKETEDLTAYQKTLLKITVLPESTAIINHFYQSLIKKRIVMLNKKQSKIWNKWKYAAVLPALGVFMFTFQLKVQAQEKEKAMVSTYKETIKLSMEIDKNSTDSELEQEIDFFKEEFDTDLEFSDIKRNANGEITSIKVTAKSGGQNKVYNIMGTEPIEPFSIDVEKSKGKPNSISFGSTGNVMMSGSSNKASGKGYISPAVPPVPPVPGPGMVPPPPPAPSANGYGMITKPVTIGDTDMLIVLNGTKKEKGETVNISPNEEIKSIVVLDKNDAKNKYGKDGKKGAMEITTAPRLAHTPHVIYAQTNGSPMVMRGFDDEAFANGMAYMSEAFNFDDFAALQNLEMLPAEKLDKIMFKLEKFNDFDNMQIDFNNAQIDEEQFQAVREAMQQAREQLQMAREEMETKRQEMMQARQNNLKNRKNAKGN